MLYPQSRLMVFCKAPEAGEVKTRLSKSFGDHEIEGKKFAARLHEYLTLHCLRRITENKVAPVQLWCSPDKSHPFFQQCQNEFNVELKEQGEGDLGERMSRAFDDVLSENATAVVIGTDCPLLSSSIIDRAFTQLEGNKGSVIVPAEDGGYVLLGLSEVQPDIFMEIPWGSSRVFGNTVEKLAGDIQKLPELWDVDRPEDLQRLYREADELGLNDDFRLFLNTRVLSQ